MISKIQRLELNLYNCLGILEAFTHLQQMCFNYNIIYHFSIWKHVRAIVKRHFSPFISVHSLVSWCLLLSLNYIYTLFYLLLAHIPYLALAGLELPTLEYVDEDRGLKKERNINWIVVEHEDVDMRTLCKHKKQNGDFDLACLYF